MISAYGRLSRRCGAVHIFKQCNNLSYQCSVAKFHQLSLGQYQTTDRPIKNGFSMAKYSRFFSSINQIMVPSMGDSITEGTINEWKIPVGSYVKEGQIIAVIDTDKVSVDITAAASGSLSNVYAAAGDTVHVGAPLYDLDTSAQSVETPKPVEIPKPVETIKIAEIRKTVEAPAIEKPKASDISTEAKSKTSNVIETPIQRAGSKERKERVVPMTRMRQRIAERLKDAQNTAAMLTTFNECDMGNIMALRSELNEAFLERYGVKMGFVSAFMLASTLSLQKFPEVNAYIMDNKIVYKDYVDISVAVATPNGLMVPVVRDCQNKTWADLEKELAQLATRARKGQIALEDMVGGTFTISNGGVYGSMMGTPIINPPQASILGMHSVAKRAVVRDDKIIVRPVMYLALTYDHRLIDGREAVLFLCSIRDYIQDPRKMLLGL